MKTKLGDVQLTSRGFEYIDFKDANGHGCSLQQSSAVDDTERGMEQPGSSFVWLGLENADENVPDRMHLHRDQARELIVLLRHWVATGRLSE